MGSQKQYVEALDITSVGVGGWALGTAEGQGQGQGEEGTGRQTNEAQGAQRQPGHQEAVDTD